MFWKRTKAFWAYECILIYSNRMQMCSESIPLHFANILAYLESLKACECNLKAYEYILIPHTNALGMYMIIVIYHLIMWKEHIRRSISVNKTKRYSIQKFDKIDSGGTSEQAESCVISNNDKEISIYCFLKDICTHRRTGGNFLGGRAKIARKILLHKIMHMISSTVNILQLVFTYFILYVKS